MEVVPLLTFLDNNSVSKYMLCFFKESAVPNRETYQTFLDTLYTYELTWNDVVVKSKQLQIAGISLYDYCAKSLELIGYNDFLEALNLELSSFDGAQYYLQHLGSAVSNRDVTTLQDLKDAWSRLMFSNDERLYYEQQMKYAISRNKQNQADYYKGRTLDIDSYIANTIAEIKTILMRKGWNPTTAQKQPVISLRSKLAPNNQRLYDAFSAANNRQHNQIQTLEQKFMPFIEWYANNNDGGYEKDECYNLLFGSVITNPKRDDFFSFLATDVASFDRIVYKLEELQILPADEVNSLLVKL